jgi:uncharacterized membrane protein YeiH
MNLENVQYIIVMAGTIAFAVTAVLAVAPKGIDLFGACVMGVITAIGGGTLRDMIMNEPVFWANDLNYVWVAIAASLAAFWAQAFFTRREIYRLMLYVDALGVALFSIGATQKVLALEFGWPVAPVLLGILTAIGGGLIRDVLAGNQTLLMTREIYAIPVMLGSTLYVLLLTFYPEQQIPIGLGCMLLVFGGRAAAIYWKLEVPDWLVANPKTGR